MQIGKTGRDALKRRVSICDVSAITLKVARRVRQLLEKHDIDSVREASQGCATFYAWVSVAWSRTEHLNNEHPKMLLYKPYP